MFVLKPVFILIAVIGPKDYSPSLIQMQFNTKEACTEMITSLKSQRSDIAAHCSKDFKEDYTFDVTTGTVHEFGAIQAK